MPLHSSKEGRRRDSVNVSKSHILEEIRRLAKANGKPPGMRLFETETGIKEWEWYPALWLQWGQALEEAGFTRNRMFEGFSDELVLEQYARLAQHLGRLPVIGEVIRESKANPAFPSEKAYRRFGGKAKLVQSLAEFCRANTGFEDVLLFCENASKDESSATDGEQRTNKIKIGYVYLVRHGSRREFKIGYSSDPIRRHGEIKIELPQKLEPVHVIETDDPAGIEAYWHRRFDEKRTNGEWFALTAEDVRAFKRWRRIV